MGCLVGCLSSSGAWCSECHWDLCGNTVQTAIGQDVMGHIYMYYIPQDTVRHRRCINAHVDDIM